MQNLLNFMGEHPVLTFFLAMIISNMIICTVKAIRGKK